MKRTIDPDERVDAWLNALAARHLEALTTSELARALRALSSCYVERRARLAAGAALGTAGKRAAFALFYGPVHFFIVRHVMNALNVNRHELSDLHDLGCGTGAAGAAWALETGARLHGVDRHPWAVAEANWSYGQLGLAGRAAQSDIVRARFRASPATGIIAAYAINELAEDARSEMLGRLVDASDSGAAILIVEPIARRLTPWWRSWESAFAAQGGVAHEWRFTASLPARQRELARAAGLDPRELTARSLWLKSVPRQAARAPRGAAAPKG